MLGIIPQSPHNNAKQNHVHFIPLWPYAIWHRTSWSTLVQVMACCLTAPSHYLNQCWLNIHKILWNLLQGNIYLNTQDITPPVMFEIYTFDITATAPRGQHICVSKLTIICSDNGLSPGRHQAIIWANAEILLIGPLGTNFNEISIKIHTFSFKKICLKMSSGKWRPFCLGLNVLKFASTAANRTTSTPYFHYDSLSFSKLGHVSTLLQSSHYHFGEYLPLGSIMWGISLFQSCFNSLWPRDTIWWHRSGSTLAQCRQATSHYLNKCWLIIS